MANKRFISLIMFLGLFAGCSVAQTKPDRLPAAYALQGTNTAVVGIALDKSGVPLETVREVVLRPGQKAVFAGPDEFYIVFKDKKAPTETLRYISKDGIIRIDIPKEIFNDSKYAEEGRRNNYLKFNYSIIVNGKELDPPLIVKRND